jgi:hypothetical protein
LLCQFIYAMKTKVTKKRFHKRSQLRDVDPEILAHWRSNMFGKTWAMLAGEAGMSQFTAERAVREGKATIETERKLNKVFPKK